MSERNRPWMPLYVDDYLRDTNGLTVAEHGAYMLLIMEYWRHGGLPNDGKRLARIARLQGRHGPRVLAKLRPLFGDNWSHKRIDAEISRAKLVSEKRRKSGGSRHPYKASLQGILTEAQTPTISKEIPSNCLANAPRLHPHISHRTEDPLNNHSTNTPKIVDSARARAKPNRKTQIDENYQPTGLDERSAEEAGMSPATFRHEWGQFRAHHIARASAFANWQQAWRTWVGNWTKFGRQQIGTAAGLNGGGGGKRSIGLAMMEQWVENYAEPVLDIEPNKTD